MTAVNIFVMTLMINLALVTLGFDIADQTVDLLVKDSDNNVIAPRGQLLGSVDTANFTSSSFNTGDPSDTQFRIIDTLKAGAKGIGLLVSVFLAPLIMALELDWPNFMVVFIAVPLMLLFWGSMIMVIRGVGN